jgi:hypothetical protein
VSVVCDPCYPNFSSGRLTLTPLPLTSHPDLKDIWKKSDPSPSPPFHLFSAPQSQNTENHPSRKKKPKKIRAGECCSRSPLWAQGNPVLSFEIRCISLQCSKSSWYIEKRRVNLRNEFLVVRMFQNLRYSEFLESIIQCRLSISLSSDP